MLKHITRADWMILAAVLFLGILTAALFFYWNAGGTAAAVISVDGMEYAVYQLDSMKTPKILEIQTKFGYNQIEVAKDGVRVLQSDCADQLEIQPEPICRPGQTLVCLPHRLVIQIVGQEGEVDEVTY